jgi:hypothetical protein
VEERIDDLEQRVQWLEEVVRTMPVGYLSVPTWTTETENSEQAESAQSTEDFRVWVEDYSGLGG